MNEDFISRANVKRNVCLMKTEELFLTNKRKWRADFGEHFQYICSQIQKRQNELALFAVSYLEYTMLFTHFINRHYISDIFVYGEETYLDKKQRFIGSYNISFLFVYFDNLWEDLLNLRKMYVGKISAQEITAFMIQTLPAFYSYLTSIARTAITESINKSPFIDIDKNERFVVNVGDYMAKTETVHEEKKNKNAEKLTQWFNKQIYGMYIFGDYTSLDFSGKTFTFKDFRYARFSGSILNGTNFEGSSLIGVNFRNANMERCCLDYCSIYEADFSNSIMISASFRNARAKVGLINDKEWKFVGFLPASFRNADLTNADFSGADLTGADFTGAILTYADFTDAILDNAIFDSSFSKRS